MKKLELFSELLMASLKYLKKFNDTEHRQNFNSIDFQIFLSSFSKICAEISYPLEKGKVIEWSNHVRKDGILYLDITVHISNSGVLVEMKSQVMYLLEFWFEVAYGNSFRETPEVLREWAILRHLDLDELVAVAYVTDAETASNKDNHIKIQSRLE